MDYLINGISGNHFYREVRGWIFHLYCSPKLISYGLKLKMLRALNELENYIGDNLISLGMRKKFGQKP